MVSAVHHTPGQLLPQEVGNLSSERLGYPSHINRIQQIAVPCLVELGVSLAIGLVTLSFTTTVYAAPMVFGAIALQTIANAALRYCRASFAIAGKDTWGDFICNYLCMMNFGYLTAVHLQTCLHECGHALAAQLLFQNARPQITVQPFAGGSTSFSTRNLTSWGQKIGKTGALCFATAMGPGTALAVSAAVVMTGYVAKSKFPELGQYLVGVGRGDFWGGAWYAFSALDPEVNTHAHDFHYLSDHGIPPLVAAIGILAIPLVLAWAFRERGKEETPQAT